MQSSCKLRNNNTVIATAGAEREVKENGSTYCICKENKVLKMHSCSIFYFFFTGLFLSYEINNR